MAVQPTSTTSSVTPRQAKFMHPTFQILQPVWQKLRDVREGTGGFIDGTYLVAHPREWQDYASESPRTPTKKLKARRAIASYENFAKTIVLALKDALTREQPTRRIGDGTSTEPTRLEEFWDNVDGAGTHIDDFMATCWDLAATFGHVFLYLDRAPVEIEGVTAADDPLPFVRVYTPLDAWDWLVDDMGEMSAIKFAEFAPRATLQDAYRTDVRLRVIDRKEWKLFDQKGNLVSQGEHGMGRLPVIPLFASRRPMEPHVGDSVLGDPNLYIDLFNLISEIRELLRNQTFSILNIPLGTGDQAMTVDQAMALAGTSKGTDNVLFSGLAAQFIQADAANITAYHAEMERKLRAIYRMVAIPWESDSQDAEAEGSMKLKREDMNQRLAGYADELERADYLLAELFYRATEGPETAVQSMENDEVQVKYPDNFDMTPFDAVLEQAQAALDLGMPALFLKELRKRLARKFDGMGDLPQALMDEIDEAIDAAPDDLTPAEQSKQRLELTMQAMKQGQKKEPKPPASPMAA